MTRGTGQTQANVQQSERTPVIEAHLERNPVYLQRPISTSSSLGPPDCVDSVDKPSDKLSGAVDRILILGDISPKEKIFWTSFSEKIASATSEDEERRVLFFSGNARDITNFIIAEATPGACLFVIALNFSVQRTAIKAAKLSFGVAAITRYWRRTDLAEISPIQKIFLNNVIRRSTRANFIEQNEISEGRSSKVKRDFEIIIRGAADDDLDSAADELSTLFVSAIFQKGSQHRLRSSKTLGIRLAYVTHFYCNQTSSATIFDLLEKYSKYSADLLEKIHFVIVDDGSPIRYEVPPYRMNITWIRIDQDISWNQSGARNIGVLLALSDNIILTDVDHVFPEQSLTHLLNEGKPCDKISLVPKRDSRGNHKNPHPNIHYLSRARFLSLYGFDEEFAGGYGAEDVRFPELQRQHGRLLTRLPRKIWCQEREEIDREREYHSLVRDVRRNHIIEARKRAEVNLYGENGGFSRRMLNFTWTTLYENILPGASIGTPQRHWYLWRFMRQWRTWLRNRL